MEELKPLTKQAIEAFKNSSESADETFKQHNIGNVMRDFNGRSHEGGKYFTFQQIHKKNYNNSKSNRNK